MNTNFIDTVSFFFKRLRIIPRFFLLSYSIILHLMVLWVMGLDDITTAQAILTSAMVTMATPLTRFYIDSGNNLYDNYSSMNYNSSFSKFIDLVGYILDKWRLIPLLFVIHYAITLVILVFWAFGLEASLSSEQATFVSIYTANASLVLSFFITTDDKNKKLEDKFIERINDKK